MTASASTMPRPMRRIMPRCARSTIKLNRHTRLRMSWSFVPGRTINSRLVAHTAKSGGGWATQLMESPILTRAQWRQLRTNTATESTFTFMTMAVGAAAIANVCSIFVPKQGRQGRLLPTACTGCSNPWDSMARGIALRATLISPRPGSLPPALSVSKASRHVCLVEGKSVDAVPKEEFGDQVHQRLEGCGLPMLQLIRMHSIWPLQCTDLAACVTCVALAT